MTAREKLELRWDAYDAGIGPKPYMPRPSSLPTRLRHTTHVDAALHDHDAPEIEAVVHYPNPAEVAPKALSVAAVVKKVQLRSSRKAGGR